MRRFISSRRLACLSTFVLVGVVGILPSPAAAMGWGDGCNPGRRDNYEHHYHDGLFMYDGNWQSNPVLVAESQILEYSPYVYAHHISSQEVGGSASAWVMLEDGRTQCVCSYAQAGWLEYPYTSRHEFYEYADAKGGHWTQAYPNNNNGAIVNNYVTYRVEYNPGDKQFRFYMSDYNNGQQVVGQVDGTTLGWTPNVSFIGGETNNLASQMPGGTGFNENFWWPEIGTASNINYHLSDTVEWSSDADWNVQGMNPADNSVANLYGQNYFGVWDDACGH